MNRHKGLFAALTALHPLADIVSAGLFVYVTEEAWEVVMYNAVAFVLQLPMGWTLDRFACPLRHLLVASWGLLAGGCAIYALTGEPVPAITIVCLGNALFHIAAGRHLLAEDEGRSARVSLFISTGAIGLILGMKYGANCPQMTILFPLLPFALLVVAVWHVSKVYVPTRALSTTLPLCRWRTVLLAALAVLVVWRSYGVLKATQVFSSIHSAVAMVIAMALCSCAGQAISGYLSDKCGRQKVLVTSLLGSAALCWLCPTEWTCGYLLLMFVAQLATGPVMSYLYSAASARAGIAFGVNCAALFLSTLVFGVPEGFWAFCAGEWLTLALEYAATAWVKLPRWFLSLIFVNLVTHPALMYAVSRLGTDWPIVLTGEVCVVIVEGTVLAALYRKHSVWWKLMLISVWMNAVSYFSYELLTKGWFW